MARTVNITFNADFRDFDKAMAHFRQQMGMVENVGNQTARSVGESFGKMGQLLGGYLSARAVADFGRQVVTVRGQFQAIDASLKVLLGSEKEATKLMSELMETATKTPFDLQQVANGAKQLLAYGESVDKVNETLIMLSDISSGAGQPINDLIYLYGTMMTQGRAYAQDIRQFTGRGIPLIEELAKVMGVAKDEVSALVTAGKIGFPEIQKAIQNMTSEGGKFYKMSETISTTVQGQLNRLQDAYQIMLNKIGESNNGLINSGIAFTSSLLENYEKIGNALAGLITAYGIYKTAIIAVNIANQVRQYGSLIEVIKRLTTAQRLLNSAVMKNPYIALASVLVGLSVSIIGLVKSSADLEKVTNKVTEANERLDNRISIHSQIINDSIDAIRNQTLAYDEQVKILERLRLLTGNENLTIEEIRTMSNEDYDKFKKRSSLLGSKKELQEEKKIYEDILKWKELNKKEEKEFWERQEYNNWYERRDIKALYKELTAKGVVNNIQEFTKYIEERNKTLEDKIKQTDIDILNLDKEIENENKEKQEEQEEKNLKLEEKYSKRRAKAKAEFYRELEQAEINHQENMKQIRKDESEYTGDKIDFNAKREEEKERYKEETEAIKKSYQDYLKGINDELVATTRTERENAFLQIDEDFKQGIEELKNTFGENSKEYKTYAPILEKQRDINKLRQESKNELEDINKAQEIELQSLDDIHKREIDIAKLRGDEQLAYESTQGLLRNQITLLDKKNAKLAEQKAKFEAIGDKQSAEKIQVEIDNNTFAKGRKEIELFDNSLQHLGRTIGVDFDLKSKKGIKALKEKFEVIDELTLKIEDAEKRLSNANTDEEKEQIQTQIDAYKIQLSKAKEDLRNGLFKQGALLVANGISKAAHSMEELAEATGNVKLQELAGQASALADILGNTAQGFASGGWIGAVVAFATSMIEGVVDSIVSAKAEVLELETNLKDFDSSLKTNSMLFNEDYYENIFGEDRMGKMHGLASSIKKFGDSYKGLIKDIEDDTEFKGTKERRNFGLAFLIDPDALRQGLYLMGKTSKEYQTYINGIKKGYDGLENMLIKTKDRSDFASLFGFEDEYTSLKDLAPELWDGGEFNVDNAKVFLETNTQITDEQRKQLQTIVEQKEQYEEYKKELDEMLNDTFGKISDSLADSLINSINEGTDAMEGFRDVALDVISDLEQQMVSSIFNAYMGNFQDRMKEIINSGGNEIDMSNLIGEMFNGLHETLELSKHALDEFRADAKEYGYDLYKSAQDAEDEILKGAGLKLTASEIRESNGNFMGLKMTAMEINSNVANMKAIAQTHNDLLRSNQNALMAIVTNTAHLQYIREDINNVRSNISVMRSDIDNINRKGVQMR